MINAELVLARRTERGMSQRQLAKHVGVSYMTISRMENGSDTADLPLSVVGRLAEILGLDPPELLRGRVQHDTGRLPSGDGNAQGDFDAAPLRLDSARLLRRIHRGDDIRRTMSNTDRQLILPALINARLVVMTAAGARLDPAIANGLSLLQDR